MKKMFLSILLMACFASVNAQLKTYTGPVKVAVNRGNGQYRTGNVTYSYKELNDERIKEGKFSFTTDEYGQTIKINGEFKDGKKNGHWKIFTQGSDGIQDMLYSLRNTAAIDVLITKGVETIMEGDYLDGLRTGKWNL